MGLLTSFIFYDILLLIVFTISIGLFLYKNKKNVEREGILYLYRTKFGLKMMDKVANKFKKQLHALSYLIVGTGYVLMAGAIYYVVLSVYQYLKFADQFVSVVGRGPPIALFIPYFPQIFGWENIFSSFPFIYFIIVIGIIAIVHEGAHGIFARLYGIRIKSTGFGFLGPILAFFVEQDDKQMTEKKIFPQLTVLGAGVFANIVTALIFIGIIFLFFSLTYIPAGVNIVDYSYSAISVASIINIEVTENKIMNEDVELTRVLINDVPFYATENFLNLSKEDLQQFSEIRLYQDLPAIKNKLPKGTIIEFNNIKITNLEDLSNEIKKHNVGDEVSIVIEFNKKVKEYIIPLGRDYFEDRPIIGINIGDKPDLKIFNSIKTLFTERGIEYKPKAYPQTTEFFFDLFMWIILANILIGFLNMLPVGIFDGGRFFYLTIFAITKSEKIARSFFKYSTIIILLLIAALLGRWLLLFL